MLIHRRQRLYAVVFLYFMGSGFLLFYDASIIYKFS